MVSSKYIKTASRIDLKLWRRVEQGLNYLDYATLSVRRRQETTICYLTLY
jgi:hypothetical protein